jgi:SAM-dependent methyltransferase
MRLSRVLDVGCGASKRDGAVGIDIRDVAGVDVVHDLSVVPWPLPSDHFAEVICQDVIEHMHDIVRFMREVHRVCAPGATVDIRTPHYSSWYAYNDPTHQHALGYLALDCFTHGDMTVARGGALFRHEERRFIFSRLHCLSGVSQLANRWPARYEQLFCWVFPCENLRFRLTTIK